MKKSTEKSNKSQVITQGRLHEIEQMLIQIREELTGAAKILIDRADSVPTYEKLSESNQIKFEILEHVNNGTRYFLPNIPTFTKNHELQTIIDNLFFKVGAYVSEIDSSHVLCYQPGRLDDILESLQNYLPESVNYYNLEYRKKRLEVFLRDGEICAKCKVSPKKGISLTIDHIKPVSKYPELFLDVDNMQVLCWDCNTEKSNKYIADYRKS